MFRRLAEALAKRNLVPLNRDIGSDGYGVRISTALARAAATAPLRAIDPTQPRTWEFSAFSQHGEDGIIDYLCSQLLEPTRFFFEIGAANGIENCTAWLAFAKCHAGIWVEGSAALSEQARAIIRGLIWNVHVINRFATPESVPALLKMCPHLQPDVFSVDIDSIDYYVASRVLELGRRPKIWVVEYNSVFGPERKVSIPYAREFSRWSAHPSGLYYGCSIAGWRALFTGYGYSFVTVEQSGCNAFFIDPSAFPDGFAQALRGETFRDNIGDLNGATRPRKDSEGDDVLPARDWRVQYPLISGLPLFEIT